MTCVHELMMGMAPTVSMYASGLLRGEEERHGEDG